MIAQQINTRKTILFHTYVWVNSIDPIKFQTKACVIFFFVSFHLPFVRFIQFVRFFLNFILLETRKWNEFNNKWIKFDYNFYDRIKIVDYIVYKLLKNKLIANETPCNITSWWLTRYDQKNVCICDEIEWEREERQKKT